jgi:hypothetical protein
MTEWSSVFDFFVIAGLGAAVLGTVFIIVSALFLLNLYFTTVLKTIILLCLLFFVCYIVGLVTHTMIS